MAKCAKDLESHLTGLRLFFQIVIHPFVFTCLRTWYARFSKRCRWFYRFSPGQSTTILVASHLGNIATLCLYLDLHPTLMLAIIVDHSSLLLILGCQLFLQNVQGYRAFECFEECCSFWYAANLKAVWRKSLLTLSPSFLVVNKFLVSNYFRRHFRIQFI